MRQNRHSLLSCGTRRRCQDLKYGINVGNLNKSGKCKQKGMKIKVPKLMRSLFCLSVGTAKTCSKNVLKEITSFKLHSLFILTTTMMFLVPCRGGKKSSKCRNTNNAIKSIMAFEKKLKKEKWQFKNDSWQTLAPIPHLLCPVTIFGLYCVDTTQLGVF